MDKKITIRFENQAVDEALKLLMNEADCIIQYKSSDLPRERRVTKSFEQTAIRTIIKEVWGDNELRFLPIGNKITIQVSPGKKIKRKTGNLLGKVTDGKEKPVPFATIAIKGTAKGVVGDADGTFQISRLKAGTYDLIISSTGYQSREIKATIYSNETTKLTPQLIESVSHLDEVIILGQSVKEIKEKNVDNIEVIDLDAVRTEASDVAAVMSRSSGITIRQSGGVGSNATVNINGLQGKAIRYFRDGIPLDYMGGAFNFLIMPANAISRVDVYKGVVPIELGSDALGGGINIISRRFYTNLLEVSYEHSSFNTHQATANLFLKRKRNQFIKMSSMIISSDNDYPVNVEITEPETRNRKQITTEKFHDSFFSFFGELEVGIQDKKWADYASVSLGGSTIDRDLQHGNLMINPYGEAMQSLDGGFVSVKYKKTFNKEKISLASFSAASSFDFFVQDTSSRIYNWLGKIERIRPTPGGELNSTYKSQRKLQTDFWINRTTVSHSISEQLELSINNVISRKYRVGSDPLGYRTLDDNVDPLTTPSILFRNISGMSLKYQILGGKLIQSAGVKNFIYRSSATNYGSSFFSNSSPLENSGNNWGANYAIKYDVSKSFLVRGSYEFSTRIPDDTEIFGDALFLLANADLTPERSHNLNFGFRIDEKPGDRNFTLELNLFLRRLFNVIFLKQTFLTSQYVNGGNSISRGAELDLEWELMKNLDLFFNATYQDLRLLTARDFTETYQEGERMPNIPYFFFNSGLKYKFPPILDDKLGLNIYGYQQYVHRYFLFFNPGGNIDNAFKIPTQNIVRVGLSGSMMKDAVTIALEANNVTDRLAYDNFRVQKPGRTWHIKINYSFK
ncbi:MAG: TonB-dependent receptor [Bacteroidota bacterium]